MTHRVTIADQIPVHQIGRQQHVIAAGCCEGFALPRATVERGTRHRTPDGGQCRNRGHVDAAPQQGLIHGDAPPRRAHELRALHDLAGPKLEEYG